jgi:transketolase
MATMTALGYKDLPELLRRLTGDEKHDWSALSTIDVLWVLFDRVLEEDDRFMLSKGHGPAAFYAVLAAKGLIPLDALDGFGSFASMLGYHPDRTLVPAAGIGSGSLGHGLGIAVGSALTGRRVYCLVGDAELDEGSNWEAVQYAGRVGLAALSAVVVDNHSSTYHWPGGVDARFALEGWSTSVVDGRDHDALEQAFAERRSDRPHVVVADVEDKR